ncbi:SPFH domain-containing protein [Brucepastera parasyntrophica]|uniref:SPFH domain-containing protein n=1 Tax=Brucepastera parasyntrophica TaxID=2880008 RepID=UPI002108AA37|nr:SPFH domain-containing protein [Brucepastera parasyntrophica]ULQ58566.1 SPFH domain-containing protein [Brucepastera parasyntrophica]
MFGFRFAKFEPGLYVFKYKKGKIIQEGEGLSFHYYARTTSLVAVPVGSSDAPFMFSETSVDFQELTIQGQLMFRVSEPAKTAQMLNFTINSSTLYYVSDDPQKLSERLINLALIATKSAVKNLTLKEAIVSSDSIARQVHETLAGDMMVKALGVEILGVSIAAIKPNPETAKALEAETREQILKESDQAIFLRRNYAIEQERIIKESELNTEIAVERKNREIQEKKMESQRLMMQKKLEMEEEHMRFEIQQEEKRKELVDLRTNNEKKEADARAYALSSVMNVYEKMNPEVLKALANANMDSKRLMAMAFQGLADRAEKIGNLNITPDLLASIIENQTMED